MQEQSYFQLISPLIFVVFAVGFYLIYRYENRLVAAKYFAFSYLLGGSAFLCDFFRAELQPLGFDAASNVFYMATAAMFAAGIMKHRTGDAHSKALGGIYLFSLGLIITFAFVDSDIATRTLIFNFLGTVLFGYPVVLLMRKGGRLIDRIILTLVGITAIQFTLRTVILLYLDGGNLTNENYSESLVAMTMQFASSVAALFLAMALFFMFGMEIVLKLRDSSETDPLTDTLNRRGMDTRLPQFETGLARGIISHSVLMVDLDNFKGVNDTFGHAAGDSVLRETAQYLRRLENSDSFVARLGGEEFVVVLYNANMSAAQLAAKYVHGLISTHIHEVTNGCPVTASVGIATWDTHVSFDRAMLNADRALYEAKADGRNCIREHGAGDIPDISEAV